ncbi:zf-HC2 domain-containing protein [Neobacillus sp. D3-1R]|uniref:zf-HC2 domain-containing protein n=1 Tax=Neobacillus sp. D3-1R TaxID=3445778 RepID=UPI003FA0C667
MSEKNHLLIKELLPLYIDDAVVEEVKKIIDEHLQTCKLCQKEWMELKSTVNASRQSNLYIVNRDQVEGQPSFIKRLKKLSFIVGSIIAGMMILFMAGSWLMGQEKAEEEKLKEDQELVQLDEEFESLSPPREAIMKKSGVKIDILTKEFNEDESLFKYRYTWDNPKIDYVKEDIYWPNHLVAMDLTNNHILHRKENMGSAAHNMNDESWTLSGIEKNTEIVGIEMPNFAVFYQPEPFEIQLNEHGETSIQKKITVNGIHFYIDRAEITNERIFVYYQQLDDISKVGLYQLSFNLFDKNDKHWSKEPKIDFQIEKDRIYNFPFFQGMKNPLTLHLEHAVLIVQGMHYKFPVK